MSGKTIDYTTIPVSFYKFVCNNPEVKSTYVGNTTNFIKRKSQHKRTCSNENYNHHNYKIYETIRANGGWDNWRMIEIEKRLVNDKREAERIETEFMEQLQSDMNCKKAHNGFETKQEYKREYYQEHKDKIHLQQKEYNQEHKENIALIKKKYRQENKAIIALKLKEYRKEHKDELSLKKKEYYQENKDKIHLKAKTIITCECGCIVRKDDLNRHKQTQKHKDLMETKLA